jgi:alpha-tubulin suppressor-like RCC1 family protein
MHARPSTPASLLRLTAIATALAACGARTPLRDDTSADAAPADAPPAEGIAQLVAGRDHTCARWTSGRVACWGADRAGQLGDGRGGVDRLAPVAVEGLTDAAWIAAGMAHTCAVRRDGRVVCWGAGSAGQLGDGASTDQAVPVVVLGLTDAVEVIAAGDHTCARRAAGEVVCWGLGGAGQLGDDGSGASRAAPVAVARVADAVELAAGMEHTCARLRSGQIMCWGRDFESQLGDNSSGSFARFLPTPVVGLGDAVEVIAGDRHTCARRSRGETRCWGFNLDGQVGDRSTEQRRAPVAVTGLADAVELAAGSNHTCARRRGGQVMCWGSNITGSLGDGTAVDRLVPVATADLADAVEITAGGNHSCARRAAGEVVCWGENDHGQLGDGSTSRQLVPTAVRGL